MTLPISLLNNILLNAVSVAANNASNIIDVKEALSMAVQVSWSGSSPLGTVAIKGSCDGVIFTTISGGSVSVTGSTGSSLINVTEKGISHLQVIYTTTSGTGTVTAVLNAKRA